MGANPRADNADLTSVYFDARGEIHCTVHADNDDFRAHEYPGYRRVVMPYTDYAKAEPAFNHNGYTKELGAARVAMAYLKDQHPGFWSIAKARLDEYDVWIADVEAKRAALQSADAAFTSALTNAHRIAWNNLSTLAGLVTFVASLSAPERAAYDAMVSAHQAFADAWQGGPNP